MLNNKLAKLTIESYEQKQRTIKTKSYEIMFNPSNLLLNCKNKFAKSQGINTSSAEAIYIYTMPKNLDLELIIDSTSIDSNTQTSSVKERIEELLTLFSMNGDTHEPPYLKIYWGDMQWGLNSSSAAFDCRVGAIDIIYSLFSRSGTPLRATLKTQFISDTTEEKRVPAERKNSPDLTHTRVVPSDSNLPLLAQEIYQNPLLYPAIATHNNLDSLREIAAGMILSFPPINIDN